MARCKESLALFVILGSPCVWLKTRGSTNIEENKCWGTRANLCDTFMVPFYSLALQRQNQVLLIIGSQRPSEVSSTNKHKSIQN